MIIKMYQTLVDVNELSAVSLKAGNVGTDGRTCVHIWFKGDRKPYPMEMLTSERDQLIEAFKNRHAIILQDLTKNEP